MSTRLDAAQADHYRSLELDNEYTFVSGRVILPLAEDPPSDPALRANWKPFVEVDVHADYRMRNFKYNASKERTPPVMPAPASQGAYTFVGGTMHIPHPSVQPDGSTRWNATANYFFAEGCASDSTVGFVLGNSLDALASQYDNANYSGSTSDALPNITQSGAGPRAGWTLAKQIDLENPAWDYREPSYFPAQLLSTEMLTGPLFYPNLSFTVGQS